MNYKLNKQKRIDGANSLFNLKIQEIIRVTETLKFNIDNEGLISYDIDPFRVGRLIEKLDNCITNIINVEEELDFIDLNTPEETESEFEYEGGVDRFNDQYPYGILTLLKSKRDIKIISDNVNVLEEEEDLPF